MDGGSWTECKGCALKALNDTGKERSDS